MTQKDIQFVVSAMLRSLTAENQDDFYYKQYLRKFNIHDGGIIEVDHVRREKYRENVETRSKVWQEKQQVICCNYFLEKVKRLKYFYECFTSYLIILHLI